MGVGPAPETPWAQGILGGSLLKMGTGSSLAALWIKDPALPLLWLCLQLQQGVQSLAQEPSRAPGIAPPPKKNGIRVQFMSQTRHPPKPHRWVAGHPPFLFVCFLGSHLQHVEVPRLGIESELLPGSEPRPQPIPRLTATPDL